jgi:glycosyltransferase involved in cell wall biosynthesis
MRLSFVVPAYNEEAYLPACLESILSQIATLTDPATTCEIIVVNNASTDRTREVALRYPGVTVVDEPRKGLTFARQAGFAASSGSLIANVDADSRLTPGWLANVLSTFSKSEAEVAAATHPDARILAALSGPLIYYDLTPRQRRLVHVFYLTAWTTYALNRYILRVGSMVQGGNFVVNRAALESIGGFNTAISFYGEDTDIARRLNTVGEVRFTFDLKMSSSARRLKSEGMLTMAARYSINYLWTTFFKRPYTDTYVDIRENLTIRESIAIRDNQVLRANQALPNPIVPEPQPEA